jgi:hypothetical protein
MLRLAYQFHELLGRQPAGTSQRYGLTHFHPSQIRNAYPKHNQADISRPLAH